MPHVTVYAEPRTDPVYQVGGKSFVFFRTPRPDAVDPETGERYTDVIVFWVEAEEDKIALVQDESSPFFTTPHFNGHLSVLLRGSRIGELSRDELAEVVQDAWLARASKRRAADWLRGTRPGADSTRADKVPTAPAKVPTRADEGADSRAGRPGLIPRSHPVRRRIQPDPGFSQTRDSARPGRGVTARHRPPRWGSDRYAGPATAVPGRERTTHGPRSGPRHPAAHRRRTRRPSQPGRRGRRPARRGRHGAVRRPLPQGGDRQPRRRPTANAGGAAAVPARAGRAPRGGARLDPLPGQARRRARGADPRGGLEGPPGGHLPAVQAQAAHEGDDRPRERARAAGRRAARPTRRWTRRRRPRTT